MHPNYFYPPQATHSSSSQTAPFAPPSAYHPFLEIYPGGSSNYELYNTHWGLEVHTLVHHASQMAGGSASTTGAAVTATTNNGGCQCRWLTGGIACTQAFANFNDLIVHLGRVHDVQGSAARKLVCQWLTDEGSCSKEYRRDGFRRHIGTHLGLSVSCQECGKLFSREDSMRAHSKKQHGK